MLRRPQAPLIAVVTGLAVVFGLSGVVLAAVGFGRSGGAAPAQAVTERTRTANNEAASSEDAFTRFERRKTGGEEPVERTQDEPTRFGRSEVQRSEVDPPQVERTQVERTQDEPSRFERSEVESAEIEPPDPERTKYVFKQVVRTQPQRAESQPPPVERTQPRRTESQQPPAERTQPQPPPVERTQPRRTEPQQPQAERTQSGLRPGQLEDPGPIRFYRGGWRTDFSISSVPFTDIRGGGPPKDGIPSIDNPIYESIDAARGWLDGRAPVIAAEVDGEARAYPMAIMTWHEIVNDTLGGTPLAVTFCPLCNTALVFERTVDGEVRDFGTSGNLYLSNLVMYDRQTETWWQQAGGNAIVGEEMGAQLVIRPAQIISLDDFEATWPDGDVLSRETGAVRPYGENPYPGYDRADQPPWNFSGTTDGRIAPKERVATVGGGDQAIAFAYPDLADVGVATESLDGEPIVVFWMPGTLSALDKKVIDESDDVGTTGIFDPVVSGRALKFERLGPPGTPITDRKTGSTWSITGVATGGPMQGTRLKPIAGADHLWFSWAAFNPETRIWQPPSP